MKRDSFVVVKPQTPNHTPRRRSETMLIKTKIEKPIALQNGEVVFERERTVEKRNKTRKTITTKTIYYRGHLYNVDFSAPVEKVGLYEEQTGMNLPSGRLLKLNVSGTMPILNVNLDVTLLSDWEQKNRTIDFAKLLKLLPSEKLV